ncbi:MAG TPA: hypothetical protein VMA77_33540 [Solirubrobacteraceae bacterium]|nr:hypothetical protein [Solirubrobacteraceae bacterium]
MLSEKLGPTRGARCARIPARGVLALFGCAVALAGCGAVRVQPTTASGSTQLASRGRIDSPLTDMDNHLGCIRDAHLAVQVLSPTKLQIGSAPTGPTVVFTATPGAAQNYQIEGKSQGAEVIGTALLYPNQGSDSEVAAVEACLDQGVQG